MKLFWYWVKTPDEKICPIFVISFKDMGKRYTECPTDMETHSNSIFKTTYLCQKVTPDLKFLGKKLSDGTLKPKKIKLEVFLKWI